MTAQPLYFQAPLELKASPIAIRMKVLTRCRTVRLNMMEMWEWEKRHNHGQPVDGRVIELAVEWTGKRGVFVDAALTCGLLRQVDGGLVVVPWMDLDGFKVDWMRSGTEVPVEEETASEKPADVKPRRGESQTPGAIRMREKRQAGKNVPGRTDTNDVERSHEQPENVPNDAARSDDRSPNVPNVPANVHALFAPNARATETSTDPETEKETENQTFLRRAAPQAPAAFTSMAREGEAKPSETPAKGDLFAPESPPSKPPRKAKPRKEPSGLWTGEDRDRLLNTFKTEFGAPEAAWSGKKLAGALAGALTHAREMGRTVDQLCEVIRFHGCDHFQRRTRSLLWCFGDEAWDLAHRNAGKSPPKRGENSGVLAPVNDLWKDFPDAPNEVAG